MIRKNTVEFTPRELEKSFRKTLGYINPLMCVADIATQELLNKNNPLEINEISKKYKHKRLNIEKLDLADVSLYVNISHIAFINSRAEAFTQQASKFVKKNTRNSKSYNTDQLDFLRKAIFQIHARNNNLSESINDLKEIEYESYAGKVELEIIDFYRKIRNIELHGGSESNPSSLSEESIKFIRSKYRYEPNNINSLNIRDVILLSQAWQTVAVNLCSKLVVIDNNFLSLLKKKHNGTNQIRRNTAIRNTLAQDFLQPEDIINTLESNGWVA